MIIKKQIELINTIKLLLYKEDNSIFNKIDFENEDIFLEPFLFLYFNKGKEYSFSKEMLKYILQGFYLELKKYKLDYFNPNDISYLPNIGYFKKGNNKPFSSIYKLYDTNIEVLKYRNILLDGIFLDAANNNIEIFNFDFSNNLFVKNILFLSNAISYIKKSSKGHWKLIDLFCKKIVLFKTSPENTNSFATINAHGIAFLNVYQENYDEVFFVDDIAHQTGHIILTTLLYGTQSIFIIDEKQNIEKFTNRKDYRDIYVLLHALYTYYTTFICLSNCVTNDLFLGKQKKEAVARIGFYLQKCKVDLLFFQKIIQYYGKIENVFSDQGIKLYFEIKNKYIEVKNKFANIVDSYNYENQTYNFEYNKFSYLN